MSPSSFREKGRQMKKKTYILIDGGAIRHFLRAQRLHYQGEKGAANYEKIALRATRGDEEDLQKILYYDAGRYEGAATLPISGNKIQFSPKDKTLEILGRKNLFAVRQGKLQMHGWLRKDDRKNFEDLTDDDYRPNLVQKGVDMRIGLDMAILAERRLIDRLILITRDTDMIPAMKHCRTQAIQIVLFIFPEKGASYEMRRHSDIVREADENWRQGLASIGADGD